MLAPSTAFDFTSAAGIPLVGGTQDVKAAFEDEGLDPFAYSPLCYDAWADEFNVGGSLTTPAGSRYEELLAFIIGAL